MSDDEYYERYAEASAYHDEVETHHLADEHAHQTRACDPWRKFEAS
jgi:hypothetical protein